MSGVAVGAGVAVGKGVDVAVGAGVAVGKGVDVAVGAGVAVGKEVAVGVAVTITVPPHPTTDSIPSSTIPSSIFIPFVPSFDSDLPRRGFESQVNNPTSISARGCTTLASQKMYELRLAAQKAGGHIESLPTLDSLAAASKP